VQVKEVTVGGAADAAGVQIADVIMEINGKSVLKLTLNQVITVMQAYKHQHAESTLLGVQDPLSIIVCSGS
jgi:C-terminal processing protease CtpA/Prc